MMLLPWRQQLPRDWATFKDTKYEMLRVLFLFVFNLHPPQFLTLYFVSFVIVEEFRVAWHAVLRMKFEQRIFITLKPYNIDLVFSITFILC